MVDDMLILQKPFEVVFAVRLLWFSIALDILNTILSWDDLLSLLPSDFSFDDKDLFYFFTKVFLVAVVMWVICKISLGYNWARIFFFLGFILSVPMTIPLVIAMFHYSKIFILISAVTTILQFTGLSLLFSDAGNIWFKVQKGTPKESF